MEKLKEEIDDELNYELININKLEKDTIKVVINNVSKTEIRFMVDAFYQTQKNRIALANQVRSIEQGKDVSNEGHCSVLRWDLDNTILKEKQYNDLLKKCAENTKTGQWLMSIKGIGPTLAAALIAYFDVRGKKAAGQFWSYAGLNNNNKKWFGKDKSREEVNSIVGDAKRITYEHIALIADKTNRSAVFLENWALKKDKDDKPEKYKDGSYKYSKENLIKGLSIIPYNAFLKTLCWKCGESFVKNSRRDSLYGKIYLERKAQEIVRNEVGDFADQAAQELSSKKWDTSKDTYKCYSEGKLPPAHIEARAKRYAVKLFISHLFEQMWIEEYNSKTPTPYILEYGTEEHNGYIEPESPFVW